MIILALLVVALILLIVGVIESSAAWLLMSTAVSVLAGFLLYRSSRALSPRTGIPAGETVGATAAPSSVGEFDSAVRNSNQLPDGNHLAAPDTATRPAGTAGKEQSPTAGDADRDDDVWVIDGRPRYHREDCEVMQGQDSERIPLRQATDDGFVQCPLCEPGSSPTGQLHIDCSAVDDQSTRS